MYGSGAATGMAKSTMTTVMRAAPSPILRVQKPVRVVCFVAATGTTVPIAAGRLFATATPPTAGTTVLASAWFWFRSQMAAYCGLCPIAQCFTGWGALSNECTHRDIE